MCSFPTVRNTALLMYWKVPFITFFKSRPTWIAEKQKAYYGGHFIHSRIIAESIESPSNVKATKVLSATSEARRLPGSRNYTFISRSPSLPWGLITASASFPHCRNGSLSHCTGSIDPRVIFQAMAEPSGTWLKMANHHHTEGLN